MTFRSTASLLALVSLAIGPVPSALLPSAGFDVAHAESSNGKSNSKNKSTNSDSRGKSANPSHGSSSDKAASREPSQGDLASELKGLNAVEANPKALEHAAPNSQVGRIAAYQDAAQLTLAVEAELTKAEKALAELEIPARGTDDIDAVIAALDPEADGYEAALAALQSERAAAKIYEDAVDAVTEAAKQVIAATEAEEDALLTASGGRDLSDEAIAHIRAVLDL